MKICFLCHEYPPVRHGGIGALVRTLAHGLARAGHEVRVLGVVPLESEAPEDEDDGGVRVWRFRRALGTPGWLSARWMLARTAMRWAERGEIDLIDAPDYQGWTAAWPRMAAPVVARLSGSTSYFAAEMGARPPAVPMWIERAALERADFLCSCSSYTAGRTRSLFRLDGAEITVLHNPVEVPPTLPERPCTEPAVVFSGTLAEKKGVRQLIRAWPAVAAACRGAKLHIYGKDGRTESGESMMAVLGRELGGARESVEFHSHVTQDALFTALESARAAIFPSYAEAFALAPLEAMAHGCPTIYSRRGSGPEVIRDGIDGLLVDPDDIDGIAAALQSVLTDAELAERLGRAGYRRVSQEFSSSVMVRRNADYFAACLERFRP